MTITMNISDTNLAELLAKVEAGEEIILARGDVPVARIAPVAADDNERRKKAIEDILAFRARMPKITQEEIAEWKAIGRR
ncbi:type II toxin-antitoxin system prevent-host-death family antitoxin [Caulobacter sp. D4A]|uniref:type II toxin-antitoxin system Phd/YefM family antitoxin n=1 Tax=Caulobacter sp. D4A TaxID=2204171 RepID=UPI000D73860B|nr:type II toxin-antitoxin system Phd/YefM family antitoxin [Caulobacter sp. D4A]PXA88020.1 type II toxin-antitoxin system prevent-host-death family antitoxin [Caulobacter sp. D4A]